MQHGGEEAEEMRAWRIGARETAHEREERQCFSRWLGEAWSHGGADVSVLVSGRSVHRSRGVESRAGGTH